MLRLAALRPLLVLNVELGPNCPLGGAKLAIQQAEEAYRKDGAADRLKVMIAPGVKHQVTVPGQPILATGCLIQVFIDLAAMPRPRKPAGHGAVQ
jgi:hypothetical protein